MLIVRGFGFGFSVVVDGAGSEPVEADELMMSPSS